MKQKKQLLKKLFILIYILGTLFSCSKSSEKKTVLNLWAINNEAEREFFKIAIEKYQQKHKNIKIRTKYFKFEDFKNSIIGTSSEDMDTPDLVFIVNDWLGELIEKGVLKQLETDISSKYLNKTIKAFTYKKKLYGLPRDYEVIALFSNNKFFEKPPNNFAEILNNKLKFDKEKIVPLIYPNKNFYFHAPFFFAYEPKIFKENQKINLKSLKNKKSFEFVLSLVEKNIIPQKTSNIIALNSFCLEKSALLITGPWAINKLNKCDIKYSISKLPNIGNKKMKPFVGVKGFGLTKYSENEKEAKDLIEYFTNQESQILAIKKLNIIPSLKNFYKTSNINESIYIDNKINKSKIFYEQAKEGIILPTHPKMTIIWRKYELILKKIIDEKSEVDETIEKEISNLIKEL